MSAARSSPAGLPTSPPTGQDRGIVEEQVLLLRGQTESWRWALAGLVPIKALRRHSQHLVAAARVVKGSVT
eukprot:COSAG06_NODE_7138_length_2616_cov_2.280095_4_plen_71_part_00